MPEFKEKPKMGQPKSKRTAMLDPCHRAMVLKEKYRQQLAERQEPESDGAEGKAKTANKGKIVCEYSA